MSTYDTDTFNLPAPSDFELTVLDRRTRVRRSSDREVARLDGKTVAELDADTTARDEWMTLPEYCDAVGIYGPLRRQMVVQVEGWIDAQLETGNAIEFPFRRSRWFFYRRYNELMVVDERDTQADVRAASHW